MNETTETSQSQLDKSAETNLNENHPQPSKTASELSLNLCQGYKVDPITKLHLCQTCPYHQYRNKSKPWLGKD
jgi:hypothetical protein